MNASVVSVNTATPNVRTVLATMSVMGVTLIAATLVVPAVVARPLEPTAKRPVRQRKRKAARGAGVIELEIDGVAMRVGHGADAKTVAAVIGALKAPS